MKYMLLIHHGEQDPDAWTHLSKEDQQAIAAGCQAITDTPGVTPGEWMEPAATATTVRVEGGKTLTTDGPFVEMKEALGGYLSYETEDLDSAIELAGRIPAAQLGGAIEIRPMHG